MLGPSHLGLAAISTAMIRSPRSPPFSHALMSRESGVGGFTVENDMDLIQSLGRACPPEIAECSPRAVPLRFKNYRVHSRQSSHTPNIPISQWPIHLYNSLRPMATHGHSQLDCSSTTSGPSAQPARKLPLSTQRMLSHSTPQSDLPNIYIELQKKLPLSTQLPHKMLIKLSRQLALP